MPLSLNDILLGNRERRATQCRKRICKWNKWKGHPDSLRADIESAYNAQPSTVTEDSPAVSPSGDLETVPPTAWDMATVGGGFGPVILFSTRMNGSLNTDRDTTGMATSSVTALHAWSDFIMNLAAPAEDSDLLRMGVQTKMDNAQHYVSQGLKIVIKPLPDSDL